MAKEKSLYTTELDRKFSEEFAKRLFRFSVDVIKLIRKLPSSDEFRVIKNQLTKSATSSGANYEEAQSAVSRADFHNKVSISLREMKESNYWLRIVREIYSKEKEEIEILISESSELKNILGSIASKTDKKNNKSQIFND